jgi:REP element-mobilizing transposase RayT
MGSGNRKRHSIRLPEYDYSQRGAYHVTICVNHRENRLGRVNDGEMVLNDLGRIAFQGWEWFSETFPIAGVDVFCIMPNHVHAIISIKDIDQCRGGLQTAPTEINAPPDIIARPKPLGRLVGAYKTHTTVEINKIMNTPGDKFWQRNYYERVIRNENEYESVWNYIENNPLNWMQDENYSA